MQTPPIDADLLDWLSKQFPDRTPEISDMDREVWAQVGAQRVIRFLRRIYDEQNDNIIERKVIS